MELLIGAVTAGVVLAIIILVVLWRAVSNAFDWFVQTFGRR